MNNSTTRIKQLTIVAVHGNGGGGFRFQRVLEHVPDDVRFEAITLPGFADVPADPSLTTIYDYAAEIHKTVEPLSDAGETVVLLGTGIGGAFVLEYLDHFADAVDAVILHAPVGARLDTRRFPALMNLPGMRPLGQWVFSSRLTRPAFKRLLFVDHTAIPDDYLNRFFDEYRQCAVFGQMFDIITAQWFNGLRPREDISGGLLWGERERVLTVDQIADYKVLLPNHIVRIVPGWDHFPMIEQPEDYAREVVKLAKQLVGQ